MKIKGVKNQNGETIDRGFDTGKFYGSKRLFKRSGRKKMIRLYNRFILEDEVAYIEAYNDWSSYGFYYPERF